MPRPSNPLTKLENVIAELDDMLKILAKEEKAFIDSKQDIKSYKVLYYKDLFTNRPYTSSKFNYWLKKFEKSLQVREKIEKIKEIIEVRIVFCASRNKINSTFAIFWLKNNAKWKDVQETKGEVEHRHIVKAPPKVSLNEWQKSLEQFNKEIKEENEK
jgi:hypothetical protein